MAKKEVTKEVAVIDVESYPMVMDQDENDVIEAVLENLEDVPPERLFSPSEGLLTVIPNMRGEEMWTGVETEDGMESFKELTGVILYIGSKRALFEGKYGEGSKIPLCTSEDGIHGIANTSVENGGPGGDCIDCEFSKFSPKDESGKSYPPQCSHKRPMYALVPEVSPTLPVLFNIPETSFGALKKYKAGLSRYGSKVYDVETKFTLKKDKTQNGKDTSLLIMEKVSNIKKSDPEFHKKIIKFRTRLLPYMQPDSIVIPEEVAAA